MNRDHLHGGARNLKGRARSALGGVTGDIDLQIRGIADQVAGGARYALGNAADKADEWADETLRQLTPALRDGERQLRRARQAAQANPAYAAVGVATLAFTLGWMARPRH